MKIKTSREPASDPDRLAAVRKEAGDAVELFTDANGALTRKAALYWADRFAAEWSVCWLEEPVSSQDTEGLHLLRDCGPAGLAEAHQVDLSGHCAPTVSTHAFCGVPTARHLEYFHTHVRIEHLAFDGLPDPEGGALRPDPARPGLGVDIRWADLAPYRVHGPARPDPARP